MEQRRFIRGEIISSAPCAPGAAVAMIESMLNESAFVTEADASNLGLAVEALRAIDGAAAPASERANGEAAATPRQEPAADELAAEQGAAPREEKAAAEEDGKHKKRRSDKHKGSDDSKDKKDRKSKKHHE